MNKDQILEAAAQIFRQKGYHATSMRDIAGAVNLQKASLYHHVRNKQEILLNLLDQALELLIECLSAVMELSLPPDERLRQAIHCYLGILTEKVDLASVLLLEHRSLEPRYHARHIPRRDRFERLWRDLIQEGADAGLFCTTNATLAARSLLGVLNWTIMWFKPSGSLTIDQIAEHISILFLNGLIHRN